MDVKGNYYSVLGVKENDSMETIKKAYRTLSKKYHPDLNKDPGASKKYNDIQQAYKVLSKEDTRIRYDHLLNDSMPKDLLEEAKMRNAKKKEGKNNSFANLFHF